MIFFLLVLGAYSYSCKFALPDGKIYDFSKLIRDIPDYEADSLEYIYTLNICKDTIKTCKGESGVATQWHYNGGRVAVIARQGPETPVLK